MQEDEDPMHELYQHAFRKMHEFVGHCEPDSLARELLSATDYALVVFRDLLEATMCAQTGHVKGKPVLGDPHTVETYGVKENIEHAEHELGLLLHFMKRAKEKLV